MSTKSELKRVFAAAAFMSIGIIGAVVFAAHKSGVKVEVNGVDVAKEVQKRAEAARTVVKPL